MCVGDVAPRDFDWPELVDLVCEGGVVPVLGSELLTGQASEAGLNPQSLALRLDVLAAADATLNAVAESYLQKRTSSKPRLYAICKELDAAATAISPALQQLAAIEDFRFFVSTTPHAAMVRALERVRLHQQGVCKHIAFSPQVKTRDLEGSIRQLPEPCVFYPLGCVEKPPFAITEEDTLEYIFQLFAAPDRPQNLLGELQAANLLFIGCDWPDWLTRFWVRSLAGDRLWKGSKRDYLEFVAGKFASGQKELVLFFSRTDIRRIDADPTAFIAGLHEKWNERRKNRRQGPPATTPPPPEGAFVFISYANEDGDAAKVLRTRLRDAGIDVWFDEDRLNGGAVVVDELNRNIRRSALFLPILSRRAAGRREGYYRGEWDTAILRNKIIDKEARFIHPVIIDDLPLNTAGVPAELWDLKCARHLGGVVTEEFLSDIRTCVRRVQR
jgi:hypothetical protein